MAYTRVVDRPEVNPAYTGGEYSHWEEVAYFRPHGITLGDVTSLNPAIMTGVAIGYHMVVVTRPTWVVGYLFAGDAYAFAREWMFWIHPSHDQTGLPFGPSLKGSEVIRTVNPGTTVPNRRDTPLAPIINSGGAGLTYRTTPIVLANAVPIYTPGIYYLRGS